MLPCEQTHSIFVRCDTAKIYSINALISGSKGTPYAHGLYHFEINCFDNYPNSPPKVSLLTGK
jgi:ubiquitin-protein ligase